MSVRKPSEKPIRKPVRVDRTTHARVRPSLGSTLGAISAQESVSNPGRMTPVGANPGGPNPQQTLEPEPAHEASPPTQPSARGRRENRR